MVMAVLPFNAFAADDDGVTVENYEKIIRYDDGSYDIIEYVVETIPTARSTTKNASKSVVHYTSGNEKACTLTVHGTFVINTGVSVTCSSATYTTQSHKSGWAVEDASASRGNYTTYATATAKGNAVHRTLGIKVSSTPMSVTITCKANGTIS